MAKKKEANEPDFNTEMFGAMLALEDATADLEAPAKKDLAAAALGRKGGLKGGRSRQAGMTPEQRRELGQRAATARWGNKGKE